MDPRRRQRSQTPPEGLPFCESGGQVRVHYRRERRCRVFRGRVDVEFRWVVRWEMWWDVTTLMMMCLEKMTWYPIKPETPIRRLSHTATQVGSYLFVMGGHDGLKYNHELLMFNLGTHVSELLAGMSDHQPSLRTPCLPAPLTLAPLQSHSNGNPKKPAVDSPPPEATTPQSSPTAVYSSSAGSTATTALTTCSSLTWLLPLTCRRSPALNCVSLGRRRKKGSGRGRGCMRWGVRRLR